MCAYYNKPTNTVTNRLNRNWTLEQALTIPNETQKHKINHKKIWTDHLGNTYTSLSEMCKHYNIPQKTVMGRIHNCKWSIEKALTTPVQTIPGNSKAVTDHLGNKFESTSELCRFYNIKLSMYKERLKLGWTVEQAITTPAKNMKIVKKECTDHLGNKFTSLNEMCKAYNLTRYCYSSRLKLGWTQEKALTTPYVINAKPCTDYKNQNFATLKDLANYYNLQDYSLQGKKFKNHEDLIDKIIKQYKNKKLGNILIVKCIKFPYFHIKIQNNDHILHIDTILDNYHNSDDFQPILQTKTPNKKIQVISRVKFPYYKIQVDNNELILSYWDIIKMNADSNFGLKK